MNEMIVSPWIDLSVDQDGVPVPPENTDIRFMGINSMILIEYFTQ